MLRSRLRKGESAPKPLPTGLGLSEPIPPWVAMAEMVCMLVPSIPLSAPALTPVSVSEPTSRISPSANLSQLLIPCSSLLSRTGLTGSRSFYHCLPKVSLFLTGLITRRLTKPGHESALPANHVVLRSQGENGYPTNMSCPPDLLPFKQAPMTIRTSSSRDS